MMSMEQNYTIRFCLCQHRLVFFYWSTAHMVEDALIRLENLRALGHTPRELILRVGNSYAYWHDLLAGRKSFGEKAARNIEAKLGLVRGSLDLVGFASQKPSVAAEEDRAIYDAGTEIPQFLTGGKMGHGLVLRDQPGMIQSWRVTPEWVQKNVHNFTAMRNLAIVTGFGDSMRPLYNPGDPLLVDRGITAVESDGIYFFRVGEEGFIKRLQRIPGNGLLAISENKSYRDWTVTKDMDFQVFAKVVKIWRGDDF